MPIGVPKTLSECRRFFVEPASAKQRQYEAFRAFFVEERPSSEVARAFGYTPGSFQVMCHAPALRKSVTSVDLDVDLDLDGDGDLDLDALALTRCEPLCRASTCAGHLHVAVAVNVHVHDPVQVNVYDVVTNLRGGVLRAIPVRGNPG